ncbi:hypothetical protein L3Q82_001469 [Scortum barcoo]|uniref:Uncharacterized protein n=1 Tax=Scortum barcoo TaxID=214431 RepID=A0ACB8W8A3_9TELE|nr:hypothetical protein L3Q82_001469 [Scortum barcoo]
MEHQLQQNNICGVWKGLKTISGFKEPKSQPVGDQGLLLTTHQVRNALKKNRARKAAGPDGISSRLLKSCADQLCGIFGYHVQPEPEAGESATTLEDVLHRPSAKDTSPQGAQQLQAGSSDVSSDEDAGETGPRPICARWALSRIGFSAALVLRRESVLAPFLFTLYTADFSYNTPSCHLQKFSDDSAVVGLITDRGRQRVQRTYSGLCRTCACGTTSRSTPGKTKELVVDVHAGVASRERQGLSSGTFYDSVVASAIFYGIVCWASSITDRDRRRMDRLVRRASSVLGCPLDSVEVVGNGRMMAKLSSLLNNTSHPLQDTLTALGSSFSERLLHPRCVKERHILSLYSVQRRSFNTAATESGPDVSQDTADPEDGVSYASVTYTKKSNSKAQKVTVEDVGQYTCRQFRSGQQQGEGSQVYLSVINMNEQKEDDKVTLNCSVSSSDQCRHTVKWLYEGKDVDKDNKDLQTSQPGCYTTVSFLTSHHIYTSRLNLFTCEVTYGHTGKVQLFPFRLQSSGDTQTPTTKPTTTPEHSTAGTTTTGANEPSTNLQDMWWLFVVMAVVLVALLITVVVVIKRRRAKGNKSRMNGRVELTSNPAETRSAPETGQDTADPEDGVSYASISFTKKRNSKAKVRRKNDDDEGDAVTYTTVKASSTDPNNLYATVS